VELRTGRNAAKAAEKKRAGAVNKERGIEKNLAKNNRKLTYFSASMSRMIALAVSDSLNCVRLAQRITCVPSRYFIA
jgi:uncharacterized pyridoxal phosphate-containing UPF0001 family protein